MSPHMPRAVGRRDFLFRAGGGLGGIALSWLMERDAQAAPPAIAANPLAPKKPHFEAHGKSGMWVSDLMPHFAECVDNVAYLRACWCTSTIHAPAMYELHTGRTLMGHPSLGSWVTYGLGSVGENLPAYCVMPQPEGVPEGGAPCWGAGYLPAVYQGTLFRKGPSPIQNLKPPATVGAEQQQRTFALVRKLNQKDLDPGDTDLQARIAS